MPMKTSASRSDSVATGGRAPAGDLSHGRATSAFSSSSTPRSRSAPGSAARPPRRSPQRPIPSPRWAVLATGEHAGPWAPPSPRRSVPIWSGPIGSAVLWHASGHDKAELRAAAWRLRDNDGAAVGLNQALDDEQAEAGSAPALRAPELTEHPRRELRRDPRTLVADGNRDSGPAMDRRRLDHGSNRTSPVPDRILDKVREHLVDLVGIQPDLRQAVCCLDPEPRLRIPTRDPPS